MSGVASRNLAQLREDALAIWRAGVAAVDSRRLVKETVRHIDNLLVVGDSVFDLSEIDRIFVIGAGKAGGGMAAGLEDALGPELLSSKTVTGWVNVPADCVIPLNRLTLHPARPAGFNGPTQAGAEGVERMLELVSEANERDLCFCLISGGGSALMPAPIPPLTVKDKQDVTAFLSAAGANIQELNTVRKQLSLVKGGGLARACKAGRLICLIISDVIGDPLDVIASGPTSPNPTTAEDALSILARFDPHRKLPFTVYEILESADTNQSQEATCVVEHHIIGNNAVAVDAAGIEAEKRGYSHAMHAAAKMEGAAEDVGQHFAHMTLMMSAEPGPDCLITGGEPVVQLTEQPGLGGRNQQLILRSLIELSDRKGELKSDVVMLAGGTDGEDGPTDAAGAMIDSRLLQRVIDERLNPESALRKNDAYHFFDPLDALIRSGPTHTNVCDLRVCVVGRIEAQTE